MSSRPCPHCNTTGRCQCADCGTPTLGHERAHAVDAARNVLTQLHEVPHLWKNPLVRLVVIGPAALTVAPHLHETFTCRICKGRGFNYIGRRRRRRR